jgi:hypothetical protein
MKIPFAFGTAALVSCVVFGTYPSYAFDLNGAWATDVSACGDIFGRTRDNEIFIKKDSDNYGGGFIVRHNMIVGKIAKCSIKSKKEDGPVTHLIATCSTDVALANVQFNFRIKDDNNIVRIYPGVEELNTAYGRCRM